MQSYLHDRGVPAVDAKPCEEGGFVVRDPDGHPIEFVRAAWPPAPRAASASGALSARILHAGLIVGDENAAHRFYREVLGFSEIWRGGRRDDVTDWVNMRVPDGTDYLEYMLTAGPPDRRQRGSAHHACLLVPDVQETYETVAGRVAGPVGPPNVGRNGRWQLNLFDDDGTRIELMEPFRIR
jgi:catechol 2,3-dioxygenase-like lactoylglutathione lyase family enzyme